jgi:hypothetical protein
MRSTIKIPVYHVVLNTSYVDPAAKQVKKHNSCYLSPAVSPKGKN